MDIELAPVDVLKPFTRPKGEHEENWYSPKLHTLWVGAASASAGNATAHELSHVLLHAFTPYGLFLQELNYMQLNQVLNYCSYAGQRIPFPVYRFSKEFRSSPARFKDSVQRSKFDRLIGQFVGPWSNSWYLEEIFEGETLPSVRAADQVAAVKALRVCEDYAATFLTDEDLFGHQSVPPRAFESVLPVKPADFSAEELYMSRACFSIGWNQNLVPLGAKHIFEGHAQRYAQLFGGKDLDEEGLISKDYGHFYLWCWSMIVHEFHQSIDRIRDSTKEEFQQVMNTFWALCDLALFTPVGVVYGRLRPKNATWQDIHPGWRFMNAVKAVADVGWLKDLSNGFSQFQNEICRRLSWALPEKFMELGSQLIDSNFLMHRDACLMRQQHPCPYLHEDLTRPEMEKFLSDHLPIYRSARGDDLVILAGNTAEATRSLLNYFLPQFCWQIMTSEQLNYEDLLPRSLRIQKVFSNVQSNDELLKIIFRGVPVIAPSNFLPLNQFYI